MLKFISDPKLFKSFNQAILKIQNNQKIRMSNAVFQQILQGHSVPLTEIQLAQFEIYCSNQNLSLDKWNQISILVFQHKREHCIHFLQYFQKTQISKPIYNDFIHQDSKVRILNNLFALLLTKATKQCSKSQIDHYINESKKALRQCDEVKMTPNVVNRAFLDYYEGELGKATDKLNAVIDSREIASSSNQNKLIAMIGLAQISYLKKNYAKALEYYKKVLSIFKTLPIKARVSMAYCFFHLEKYEMAKACFQRVLKLQSKCVEAYIGIAVIEQRNDNFGGYFQNLSKAVKINKKHPLVLVHLAEHFLIKEDLDKALKIAQEGILESEKMAKFFVNPNKQTEDLIGFKNDYLQLKARFNNILGQVQHIKNNYIDALRYYRLATNPNLSYNEIYLSQVYIQLSNYAESLQILQKLFKQSTPTASRLLNESLKDLAYVKSKNLALADEEKSCEQTYNEAIIYNKNDTDIKIELANQIMEAKKARALKLLQSAYKILQIEHSAENIKPELLNNIGVLHLQNHEYSEANNFLEKSVEKAQKIFKKVQSQRSQNRNHPEAKIEVNNPSSASNQFLQSQSVKLASTYLVSLFNYGIVKEKLCLFTQAIKIYQSIIQLNKHFIDAHIRMAYVYFVQGNFKRAMEVLQEALKQGEDRQANFIRFDKITSIKLALLKVWGDQVAAKEGVKLIAKHNRDIYTQIFQLSLQYEQLIKRQPEMTMLKQFLRPNREIYMRLCYDDPHCAFGYLVLAVLLLTDRRLGLKQGSQLFTQLKQHISEDVPSILYNMGLFYLNYDDYQKAKFSFKSYKEKINDEKGEQLVALTNVLEANYSQAICSVKKCIMMNPANFKFRYQLFYTTEKKIEQERQDERSRLKLLISNHLECLKKCHKFYTYFSKLNVSDYVKCYESPDMKQLTRNQGQKVRGLCDERKFYVGSNIDYYEKMQKDESTKLKDEEERQLRNRNAHKFEIHEENENNILRNEAFDESDSEQLKKRKKQQKRRKALQLARKKDQQIQEKFEEIKERQREQKEKKLARMNKEPKERGTKKREKKQKAASSENQIQYESEKSLSHPLESSPSQAELDEQNVKSPKRSRREGRQDKKGRKKVKKDKIKYEFNDDKDLDSNPFKSEPNNSNRQEDEDIDDYYQGQNDLKNKKKDKKKDEDEDVIDVNAWII